MDDLNKVTDKSTVKLLDSDSDFRKAVIKKAKIISGMAYPVKADVSDGKGNVVTVDGFGLSKREWFTGMAVQGILSTFGVDGITPKNASVAVSEAIMVADEIIKQLNK